MEKDYKTWHSLKTLINNDKPRTYFYEGEIWFCNLGLNIGVEQDGKGVQYLRPVIVLKKFNHKMLWVIPLTKRIKSGLGYYSVYSRPNVLNTALLFQMKLIDSKRLKYKIGFVSVDDLIEIKIKLKQMLEKL